MNLDPIAAYDRIAPVFARIAKERKPYLDSIDRLVISLIPPQSHSMLDVGSGDGRRARRIAQQRDIADLVLMEPSVAMQGSDAGIRTMRAEELHLIEREFDAITCLWNVLGRTSSQRPAARRFSVSLRVWCRPTAGSLWM